MLTYANQSDRLSRIRQLRAIERECTKVCDDYGWGSLPEWNAAQFNRAYDTLVEAKAERERLVTEAWIARMFRGTDRALGLVETHVSVRAA